MHVTGRLLPVYGQDPLICQLDGQSSKIIHGFRDLDDHEGRRHGTVSLAYSSLNSTIVTYSLHVTLPRRP